MKRYVLRHNIADSDVLGWYLAAGRAVNTQDLQSAELFTSDRVEKLRKEYRSWSEDKSWRGLDGCFDVLEVEIVETGYVE